jgi:hypothetical protein
MKFPQEKALLHLIGKSNLDDLQLEAIEQLVSEHPFFSPAQFLFSAKLQKEAHPLATAQAIKTSLFFSNPHWLQCQLDSINESSIVETPKFELDTALLKSMYQEEKTREEMINPSTPAELMNEAIDESALVIAEKIKEPTVFMPVFSAIAASEIAQEQVYGNQPSSNPVSSDQAKSDAKIASILSAQLAEFKKPIDTEVPLDINNKQEKLYTIDYFASQGIQIDLSKIPQDKLTTKLRKFTDWLKDIKNHHPNPADLESSPELEKKVAETAMFSNESKEILTETMAEVLAKQGQIDKAIQLFIKLSFSNPEKSAYFATKIQQLKGI